RVGRDQRAALPVAEGDHGRQAQAAGDAVGRRPRPRRRRRRRGRLAHDGDRAQRAASAWRHDRDRGRRLGSREGCRLPRRAEAAVSTLVFLEHHEDELLKGALGVLSKAAELGDETVAGVVAGAGVAPLAGEAGRFGAATVYVADDQRLAAPLPQPRVDVLAALVREHGFDTVLFGASVLAADVAAGLAARLDAGLNWDLVDLERRD